jgi:hypothetical protein
VLRRCRLALTTIELCELDFRGDKILNLSFFPAELLTDEVPGRTPHRALVLRIKPKWF